MSPSRLRPLVNASETEPPTVNLRPTTVVFGCGEVIRTTNVDMAIPEHHSVKDRKSVDTA